jgi:hypothetical protein
LLGRLSASDEQKAEGGWEMNDIQLKIVFDIRNGKFSVSGNAKNPKDIVSEFLRTQIGV